MFKALPQLLIVVFLTMVGLVSLQAQITISSTTCQFVPHPTTPNTGYFSTVVILDGIHDTLTPNVTVQSSVNAYRLGSSTSPGTLIPNNTSLTKCSTGCPTGVSVGQYYISVNYLPSEAMQMTVSVSDISLGGPYQITSDCILPQIYVTDCAMNGDPTTAPSSGTFRSTVVITGRNGETLSSGQNWNVQTATGAHQTDGNTAGLTGATLSGSFTYCNGGCPPGVNNGYYYKQFDHGSGITYNITARRTASTGFGSMDLTTGEGSCTNPTVTILDCVCNNDNGLDTISGSFTSTLVISNPDGTLPVGMNFEITGSTNAYRLHTGLPGFVIGNNPIVNGTTLAYCSGGCPAGVTLGQYYMQFSQFHGQIPSFNLLGLQGSMSSTGENCFYPALPVSVLPDTICLESTTNYTLPVGSFYSDNQDPFGTIDLPAGFSQTTTVLTVNPDLFEDENIILYLHVSDVNGCFSSSSHEINLKEFPKPDIQNLIFNCVDVGQVVYLTEMFSEFNQGVEGVFSIDSSGVMIDLIEGQYTISQAGCFRVVYEIDDPYCGLYSDTAYALITLNVDPSFELSGEASPLCLAGTSYQLTLTRTSFGSNPTLEVTSSDPNYSAVINGNIQSNTPVQITLASPPTAGSVSYSICLTESNSTPNYALCNSMIDSTFVPCTETNCFTYIVYNDGYGCGSNAVFSNNCQPVPVLTPCSMNVRPNLTLSCRWFSIRGPRILNSEMRVDKALLSCEDEFLTGTYRPNFNGILSGVTGGPKMKDMPGVGTICKIFGFKILGWRPLGALYNIMKCDSTIGQFIVSALSSLIGGDGGGGIFAADTYGTSLFNYSKSDIEFGTTENFSVPNQVIGNGNMTIRLVTGWPVSPDTYCGNPISKHIFLLDLLPIGAIPIVGPIIEDILATAGCNIDLTFSDERTMIIPVRSNDPPDFVNCNLNGYQITSNLDCDIPANWSIPVALEGCTGEVIPYRGITSNVNQAFYTGGTIPTVTVTEAGLYQTAGPVIGSHLPPGEYVVSYLAVSCNGNPSTCDFNVIVTTGDPILECPNSITIAAEPQQCSSRFVGLAPYQGLSCATILNYSITNPDGSIVDTDDDIIGTHNIPDGYDFQLGTSIVTYTLLTDINGDSQYIDEGEIQVCSFTVTVVDEQNPIAVCSDISIKLNNQGEMTVNADDLGDGFDFINAGSTDNCPGELDILISRDGTNFFESIDFLCENIGYNILTLRVEDLAGNVEYCIARVEVIDFFDGYTIDMNLPDFCFGPFQNSIDLSPYVAINRPNGNILRHPNVGSLGPNISGEFIIAGFLPDSTSTDDPGTISPDGIYTSGTGSGYITLLYILKIDPQFEDDEFGFHGCYISTYSIVRIDKLTPDWIGGNICCDASPIWLGGANDVLPSGLLTLESIGGSYPIDKRGEWLGQGVSFVDPDGENYSGDEYYQFDPNGLDGEYTLTYIVRSETCEFRHSQTINVTCQDLQIGISDIVVCPANIVPEIQVVVNLDDHDLEVTTVGMAAVGGVDLNFEPVVDGRVVIPSFSSVAVSNDTFPITVITSQSNPHGCVDIIEFNIIVIDTIAPIFTNCPRPHLNIKTAPDECGNYVNFSMPIIYDNCDGEPLLERIDSTGQTSGSYYLTGRNTLIWQATDTVGNFSICEIDIYINDDNIPTITCPGDLELENDPDVCEAVVAEHNVDFFVRCEDNANLTYSIEYPAGSGDIISSGLGQIQNELFYLGNNTLTYRIQDQPLLLITEATQQLNAFNGTPSSLPPYIDATNGDDFLEITNFGPAAFDISRMQIERLGTMNAPENETFQLPLGTVLEAGEVAIIHFGPGVDDLANRYFNLPDAVDLDIFMPAAYVISLHGRVIDLVAMNGYDPTGQGTLAVVPAEHWLGAIPVLSNEGSVYRKRVWDTNSADDWAVSNGCDASSMGIYNPQLPLTVSNGTTTALQTQDPNSAVCSVNIAVIDTQNPYCAKFEEREYNGDDNIGTVVLPGECLNSEITISDDFVVGKVELRNITGSATDLSGMTLKLISPKGTEVVLYSGGCTIGNAFNFNMSDDPNLVLSGANCALIDQEYTFLPIGQLSKLIGESAQGTWILEIGYTASTGQLTVDAWTLFIYEALPYDQDDVVLENDLGECGAEFTWTHPFFMDNCVDGTIRVDYSSMDGIVVPQSGVLDSIGGYEVTEFFEVGTTLVYYTLTDGSGNVANCGFEVTVLDTEDPVIAPTYCRDVEIPLLPGECITRYNYPPIDATDNCAIDQVIYDPAPGYYFPIGETEVVVVVVDPSGNTDTCSFIVNVIEFIPDNSTIACNDVVKLSLGFGCEATIGADYLLEGGPYRCYDNYCVTLVDELGRVIGRSTDSTNILTLEHVGTRITATVCSCLDPIVNCCTTIIEVEALSIPLVICPEDVELSCNEPYTPEFTGEPMITNCVPGATINFFDTFEDFGICNNPRAEITRNWVIMNQFGDKVTCTQKITFTPFDPAGIEFPQDWVLDNALDCEEVSGNAALITPVHTGYPTLNGKTFDGTGFCEFNIGYRDQILQDENCSGGYEILRYWIIRDECRPLQVGVNPIEHIQAIKVNDKKAPTFVNNCLNDVTLGTDVYNCSVDYNLGNLSEIVVDGCSRVEDIFVVVAGCTVVKSSAGEYIIQGMKVGQHTVKIMARDDCWNFATCEFQINVIDNIAPVAVCVDNTVVTLLPEGVARVFASSFDNGSYDNCGTVKIEVYRMTNTCGIQGATQPGAYVDFCCEDVVNSPVQVIMRVWDDADNNGIAGTAGDRYNECMIEVTVDYKAVPSLVCPADITVDCLEDIYNTDVTGVAQLISDCPTGSVYYTDIENLNHCGIGNVIRVWRVEGYPQVTCNQYINILSPKPFNPLTDIVWPLDWEGNCLDSIPYNAPILNVGICETVAVSHDDQIFSFVDGVCYKILRRWKVIDWCVYQANIPNSPGLYMYDQVIKISDDIAPEIANCDPIEVGIEENNCTKGTVILYQSAIDESCGMSVPLRWDYRIDLGNNGTDDVVGTRDGSDLTVYISNVEVGVHKITWIVRDGCGNVTSCDQLFEVKDKKLPSPICTDEIVAVIMENSGGILVDAYWFNVASFDNCTNVEDLRYSFSGTTYEPYRLFTCDDIENGVSQLIELEMWVWDLAGNRDFCNVRLLLQDNNDTCPDSDSITTIQIAGSIYLEDYTPVDEVDVLLETQLPGYPLNQQVVDGNFVFGTNPSPAMYEISANRNTDLMEGVNTLDFTLIQRHVLGIEQLGSPYKLIAADINNDTRINAVDMKELRSLILRKSDKLTNNLSWRFIDASEEIANPQNPWPFKEAVSVVANQGDQMENNLIAIKVGDVDNSVADSFRSRSNEEIEFFIDEALVVEDQLYDIEFYSNEFKEVHGYQYTFEMDGIEILDVNSDKFDVTMANLALLNDRYATMSVGFNYMASVGEGELLFTMKVRVSKAGKLSEMIQIGSAHTPSEIYIGGKPRTATVILGVNGAVSSVPMVYDLYQNEPNPFKDFTTIGYVVPQAEGTIVRFHDVSGKEVMRKEIESTAGYNEIRLERAQIPSGVLYYTLESGDFSATKTMILVN